MTSVGASRGTGYRPEIDGLRALAVVAVIINHFHNALMPSGYLGVDIFFVISGYVISWSLHGSPGERLGGFLLGFYARRVKRLVPALAFFVLVTGLFVTFFDPDPGLSLKTGANAMFGLSNIYLFTHAADYFAPAIELNVFTNTWSLGVEEQFYLLFPALLWFVHFRERSVAGLRNLMPFIALLSLASFIAFIFLNRTDQPLAYFSMPTRFWELGAGCMLYLVSRERPLGGVFARVPPLLVLVLLIAVLFLPLRLSTLATIGSVALTALLIATLRNGSPAYWLFTRKSVVYIGQISYSLYLWHWSVLSLSRWTVGLHLWTAPFQVALMLGFAAFSYHVIERPLRHAPWSASRGRSVMIGLSGSLVVYLVLMLLIKPYAGALYSGVPGPSAASTASDRLDRFPEIVAQAEALSVKCNMTPQHLTGADYRPRPDVNSAFLHACLDVPMGASKLLLVGDSFAQASVPQLGVLAHQLGLSFRTVFGYGCPYPLLFSEMKSPKSAACRELDVTLLRRTLVASLNKGDLLVVRLYLPKPQYLDYEASTPPAIDAYDKAFAALSRAVAARGAKLLVIGANPTLTLPQVQSLTPQWFNFDPMPSRAALAPDNNQETIWYHQNDQHLQRFFARLSGASYFSLNAYLCNHANMCRIADGPMLLYRDSQHITPYAYDLFADDLAKRIRIILGRR